MSAQHLYLLHHVRSKEKHMPFVPARIKTLETVSEGELRVIQLELAPSYTIKKTRYPVMVTLRPGSAFLARPFGVRTQEEQSRLYTRSNCGSIRILEAIIDRQNNDRADTSWWWNSPLPCVDDFINVRMDFAHQNTALSVYEHLQQSKSIEHSLRLESDKWWSDKKFVMVALSTGIAPFLSIIRHMQSLEFGRTSRTPGAHVILIASARSSRMLIAHQELMKLQYKFPHNFMYHPVLTQRWSRQWSYTRGRIIKHTENAIDLSPFLNIAPDFQDRHFRFCGNATALQQFQRGFARLQKKPLSMRAERW